MRVEFNLEPSDASQSDLRSDFCQKTCFAALDAGELSDLVSTCAVAYNGNLHTLLRSAGDSPISPERSRLTKQKQQ